MAVARNLVVGYDDSDCARSALDAAVEMAQLTGDRVVIVFGYEPPTDYGEESSEHRQALEEVGQRVTVAALERARRAGVDAEVALRAERSVDALLSLAEERDARAIVVGTYGEHPIKDAILGSTPHKLLHLSERPVLVVPASS